MSDLYREILVPRKTPLKNKLAKAGLVILTVLGFLAGMVFIPLMLLGLAGIAACVFLMPRLEVEYEYLYVNGDLDIDAIYSRQKRKRIAEYHVEELEILAPEKSHALDSYRNKAGIKVRDFTSGDPNKKAYAMVMNMEKGQELVKVEIDEVVLGDLRRLAPRKVNLM